MHNSASAIWDANRWNAEVETLAQQYQTAAPYPHIVLENFLENWAAGKCLTEFPGIKDTGWIHYVHYNEKKHGLNKMDMLPLFIAKVIEELNSKVFLQWLERLTGIPNLLTDEVMEGGGLHQSKRGGFLNIHADFTVHPHHRTWQRRINVLVYFNPEWLAEYGGALELWERDISRCVEKILPIFNRCVIFNTERDTYHGHPDPMTCPEQTTRKSLALYYFTENTAVPYKQATDYRARPGENALPIYLDKTAVSVYTRMKGMLGLNDDFASKVLNIFSRHKKKDTDTE